MNENTRLLLVGDGYLKATIMKKTIELGITDKVIFIGVTEKVEDYLSAMDVFLFPSLFEGLGIALVEAQTNGLPCIYSDVIPSEANIIKANNISLSLKLDSDEWAKKIIQNECKRYRITEEIMNAGYEICSEALKLEQFYKKIYNEKI